MSVDTIDLTQAIWDTAHRIEKGVDIISSKGRQFAEAERDYRKKLAIEIMKLKDAKVPVSIINDIARGNLSDELFKRNLAEIEYKSCRDMLTSLQAELNAMQSLLKIQSNI